MRPGGSGGRHAEAQGTLFAPLSRMDLSDRLELQPAEEKERGAR